MKYAPEPEKFYGKEQYDIPEHSCTCGACGRVVNSGGAIYRQLPSETEKDTG
jgi:hypothetical protein